MLYTASFLDPRFKALPFLAKEDQLEVHANVVAEAAALGVNYLFLNNIYICKLRNTFIHVENG